MVKDPVSHFLASASSSPFEPASSQKPARPSEKTPPPRKTVLLVDDEESVLRYLTRLLEREGYRVLRAHNADEALRLTDWSLETIDLLLTDVIMPGMNGRKLADALHEKAPGLQVIFISGYAEDILTQEGMLEFGCMLLEKPIDPILFKEKIKEALGE